MDSTDFAGASALGSLFAIFVIGMVGSVLGYAIDKSNFMFVGLASQDASNTIFYLETGFWVAFVLILVAVVLNHWINEKNSGNQGV